MAKYLRKGKFVTTHPDEALDYVIRQAMAKLPCEENDFWVLDTHDVEHMNYLMICTLTLWRDRALFGRAWYLDVLSFMAEFNTSGEVQLYKKKGWEPNPL